MLLNQQGQQVPATSANIMNPLIREVKDVDNHRCYSMFTIETRARMRQTLGKGQSWAVWCPKKRTYVLEKK